MSRSAYVEVDEGAGMKCDVPPHLAIHEGDQCIVEMDNVLESGEVKKIQGNDDKEASDGSSPRVLRRATLQDQARVSENVVMGKIALKTCVARAEKYGLDIRVDRVRYSFDRSVLTVMFTSEDRVDFREMVKELAGELHTRVDMKQIGVRDEAAIVGGMGPCGRKLCCCDWLRHFDSINVKMAKSQRLSLNPGAISGMCGRLRCCLRYEYDNYREMDWRLPRVGAKVDCPGGRGEVIDKDILAQKIRVRLDDDHVFEYSADEVKKI